MPDAEEAVPPGAGAPHLRHGPTPGSRFALKLGCWYDHLTSSMGIAGQYAVEDPPHSIPATMKAAVYRGVNDVRVETVPVPKIGPRELLIRVHSCGVCGTDLKKIATGSHSAPRIFGHETSGVVAATGAQVLNFLGLATG